jgi:hypothetical protein
MMGDTHRMVAAHAAVEPLNLLQQTLTHMDWVTPPAAATLVTPVSAPVAVMPNRVLPALPHG